MKLELVKNEAVTCTMVRNSISSREETLEMIVPDSCPDIAQVLDTNSICCLTRRELTGSGALLAGTIKSYILYLPEGGKGIPQRLEAEIPFQHLIEQEKLEGNCALQAWAEVLSGETRVINSRKVLLRVDLKETVRIWEPKVRAFCCGLQGEERWGLQQQVEHYQMALSRMPREKCFTIEEELDLQEGKGEVEAILSVRPRVYCSESRIMGARLMLKGGVQIQALCRRSNGELTQIEQELPVSQMVEADELGEGARYQADLQLLSCYIGPLSEDGRASCSFELAAQAQFYEVQPVAVLTDGYSTRYPLDLKRDAERCVHLSDNVMRKALRETLNTEEAVRQIHFCHAELGIGEETREGTLRKLKVPVLASVLYQGEDGKLASVSKRFDLLAQAEAEEGSDLLWSCRIAQTEALLSAAGIELRLTAEFQLREQRSFELQVIREGELDQDRSLNQERSPSVVLRCLREGETLWDLAKCYRTTGQAICSANGAEEGKLPRNQMLLIPRGR